MLQFPSGYGGCTLCGALQSCRVGGRFDASCLDVGFGNHSAHNALVEPLRWTINFGKLVCGLTESDALLRIIRNFKEGMYAITIAKTRN
jgi:hypothetical protein